MKKMSMILAVLAAMMIAGGALALTDTEAETAARAYVPAEAQLTRSEMDDGMHELTFRVKSTRFRSTPTPARWSRLKANARAHPTPAPRR